MLPGVRHVDTAAEYGTEEAVARGGTTWMLVVGF